MKPFGQCRQAIGVSCVGAQEDGHTMGMSGCDPSDQPARGLGALECRQEVSKHRLGRQQRPWSKHALACG
jgi:hypothetical protein